MSLNKYQTPIRKNGIWIIPLTILLTFFIDIGSDRIVEMMQPLQPDDFLTQSHAVLDFIVDYYKNIESYPVQSQVEPGYLRKCIPDNAPYSSEPIQAILQDISNDIIPGLTHWQSPNFFAYFQANASNPGFIGEMLCTGFNVVGFNWIASPAATELESIVVDWMGKMLKLPSAFIFSKNEGGVENKVNLFGSSQELGR